MPEYQDQQYIESQKQAGLLGAIPVWGQFAKIGQAIGSQTMDKHGIYKSRAAGVVDNIVNPSTWVQNLKDVFKKPTFSGIANELTLGIFGQSATQKRRKAEMAAQKTAWQNKQNQIGGAAYANEQMAQYSGNQPKAMFRFGGQSTKPRVIKGGRLEKISTSAVQVKGNQPSKKDDVETQTAKLDHNEVVDRQNRVYSDQLRHTDGRSIAEHAKTIEQRRVVNPQQADKDLDELYTFQEKSKLQNGGVIPPKHDPKTRFNTKLTTEENTAFQTHTQQFPSLLNDQADYDTQGLYQELYRQHGGDMNKIAAALTPGSPTEHIGTDRYKKPTHPTFSNESKYSIPIIRQGGKWKDNFFVAKNRNIRNMNKSEDGSPEGYFKRAEDLDSNGIPDIGLIHHGKILIKPQQSQILNSKPQLNQGGLMRINRAHSTAYQNPKAITIAPADAKQHLSGGGMIKKKLSLGGKLDTTAPPDTSSPMMTKKLQPMGRTRMGLRLPPKGVVKEPETQLTNVPNKAGKPPKIRNFTRSGYR